LNVPGVAEFLHCLPMETCPGSNDLCDTSCKTRGHHEGGGCLNVGKLCCCIGWYFKIVFKIFIKKISWKINVVILIQNNIALVFYQNIINALLYFYYI